MNAHVVSPAQLQNLWDALDIGHNTTDEVFVTRVYDLLPSNPVFSHYNGSLTTPPCTEVTPLSKHNTGMKRDAPPTSNVSLV